MKLITSIALLRWVFFTASLLLLVGKISYIVAARQYYQHLPLRPFWWFSSSEIDGTTSQKKRDYMKKCNLLTTVLAVLLVLFLTVFLLPIK